MNKTSHAPLINTEREREGRGGYMTSPSENAFQDKYV